MENVMKGFWDVKHKGFSTIVLLGILSFVSACMSLFYVRLEQLKILKQINAKDEKIEIQIIKEIKQCYYQQNCENHESNIEGMNVEFYFEDLDAQVVLENGLTYRFTYDEPFMCIGSMDIYAR